MQQNARIPMGIPCEYYSEGENGRYLIELGLPGYLLIWTAGKLGLCVALLRAYTYLKKAKRRAAAGAALAYSLLTLLGNLTFDHVWQALFFTGCGFILSEVLEARRQLEAARAPVAPEEAPLRPVLALQR
jgi:hypothetical protein